MVMELSLSHFIDEREIMLNRSTTLLFAFLLVPAVIFLVSQNVLPTGKANESQTRKQVQQNKTIKIGQPIKDVRQILQNHKIKTCENCLQIMASQDDHLEFTLDEETTDVAIFYSRSKQTVNRITMMFIPPQIRRKGDRLQCRAKAIRLLEDRSYSVHFEPPRTKKAQEKRQQNKFSRD